MSKIITFGEILLRLSSNSGERISQANQLHCHYGGAEANVGISLANFEHEVYFVSKVPDNPLGIAAISHLKSAHIHTHYLLKGGDRLGTYYLEPGVGLRSSQVTYDRKHSSLTELMKEELDFDEIFQHADLFHVSGVTPALSPALREITQYALKKAKEYGVMTSFDFNYRSKLWSQQEAAHTIKTLLPYVDICSCGELDAVHLLNIEQPDDQLEKEQQLAYYYGKIQQMFPNIKYMCSTYREVISASVNTLQGNFYTDGRLYQSKIYQIDQIVDRVGGGDAFMSGILHGILDNMEPEETVAFATATSALKHTVHGDCSVFNQDEVQAFIENGSGKIVR